MTAALERLSCRPVTEGFATADLTEARALVETLP
jgi:hypothetical protein